MNVADGASEEWNRLAAAGDREAVEQLMAAHRSRLCRRMAGAKPRYSEPQVT